MKQKATKPVIRFAGFTDDWEQRKLREVGNVVTGSTPSTLDKTNYNGSYLFVSPADIQGSRYVEKTITTLSEKGFRKGRILREGAILFVSIGSTIGKVAQIRQEAVTNQQINAVIPHEDYDDNFIFSSLVKESEKIRLLSATQAVPIINKSTFSNIDIHIPGNIKEQIQIGAFFDKMDDTIALHQRQLEALEKTKKSFLQKMFPKKDETKPEIRFAGFTDDWEQRKLGEITKRVTRKNKELESTLPLTISAQYGLVDQITYFDKRIASKDVSNYYLIKKGEFAYNKSYSKDFPWGAVKRLDNYDKGVLSTLYIVFKPTDIESNFLVSYYDTTMWHKEVSIRAAEGARNHGLLNITAKDFFDTDLIISTNSKEQQKIGSFFKQLDDTIALHQRQLEALEMTKKSFLQKMFI